MASVKTLLFPELLRFPSPALRKRAWKRAEHDLLFWPPSWVVPLGALGALVATEYLLPELGVPGPTRHRVSNVLFFVVIFLSGAGPWVFRRRIQRSLRHELCEIGQSVCVKCGYDLRSNTAGICPECGTSVPLSLSRTTVTRPFGQGDGQ